jgi:LacI family transcriptional regulator
MTPTLQTIADKLGVSKSTISLGMRNDPRIASQTRARIHETARQLGYQARPEICRLMSALRIGARKTGETYAVALVVPAGTEASQEFRRGLDERLALSGYHAELFRLSDVTAERLAMILRARGVEAALVVGSEHATTVLAASGQYCVRFSGEPKTHAQGFTAGVLLADSIQWHRTIPLHFNG